MHRSASGPKYSIFREQQRTIHDMGVKGTVFVHDKDLPNSGQRTGSSSARKHPQNRRGVLKTGDTCTFLTRKNCPNFPSTRIKSCPPYEGSFLMTM